jgi:hypothetical protein
MFDWQTQRRARLAMTLMSHDKPSQPDIVHDDIAGAEKRLRNLKGGFRKVSGRWDQRLRLKNFFGALVIPTTVVICCVGFFWWLANNAH